MLLVSAGTAGVAVKSVEAAPSARYRAWLLGQVRAERAALVRAALDAMRVETATPSLFLSRYAEAQLAVAAGAEQQRPEAPADAARPTGAWFGHPNLSFLDALALLEGHLRAFGAPATPSPAVATLAPSGAVVGGGAVPMPSLLPTAAVPAPTPAATAAALADADGATRAVLHETSAAQPCGP